MAAPTTWQLDPHTGAKHSILRRYLQAFFPKLSWKKRIVFIDGFAGPGVYTGGAPGSPIIALDAAVTHSHDMSGCEFVYLFIEEGKQRFDSLKTIVEQRQDPSNIKIQLLQGTFEEHMTQVLDDLGQDTMAPAFVMVDPFGVKGLPLALLERIAKHPKTELLVSVMYESITRFMTTAEFEPHMDELFGTDAWRQAIDLPPNEKKQFLRDLYAEQLQSIGMEYVRSFELRDDGNRTEYFLAFGTHSKDGLRAMKDAMWKVDAAGGYEFSDFTALSQQPTLFAPEPDYDQLDALLVSEFAGRGAIPIEDINDFVLLHTAFRETHGRDVLRRLASPARQALVVQRPPGKNSNYWNAGTVVTFL